MKKLSYLMLVILVTTSCARGFYAPNNVNQFGTQTQVVLGQANFRIVRHLEVVIDINNTNLKRADVEKSAYAELLRRANLTGSQALINVVIEEVRRESTNIFRILFSNITKITQHVAARATIIEFLDEPQNPLNSVSSQGVAPREEVAAQHTENYPTADEETNDVQSIINEISDNKFKEACLKQIDTNYDGIIDEEEALSVLSITKLDFSGRKISSLQGIEIFENLEELNVISNNLTTVDLSKNKKLRKVQFNSNPKLRRVYFAQGSNVKTNAPIKIIRYK